MKLLNCKIALLAFLLFTNCSEKIKDEKYRMVSKEVHTIYRTKIKKNTKHLIIINDYGCSNCVKSFANYVLHNMDKYKDNSLILISSKGHNVDIDSFAAMHLNNVIIIRKSREPGKTIPYLGIIYLKENLNEVDTILSIDATSIIEQMNYMKMRN